MGNADTKLNFRKAVIQLTTKTQPIEASDEAFWEQFWSDSVTCVQDVFTLIPAAEIRALREESPSNLATLCYKAVEKLVTAAESGCPSQKEQQTVLNCVRLLTRVLPYIFEDPDWRGFFWSTLPGQAEDPDNDSPPLAQSLINAVCDLQFCPEFSVPSNRKSGPNEVSDVVYTWNCHRIRASTKDASPKGKPTVLYFLPHLYGAEDKLKPVNSSVVDTCEEECSKKNDVPCEETVFELCTLIMTEMGWSFPSEKSGLSDLYLLLREEIRGQL